MSTDSGRQDENLQERVLRATVPYALMALGLHMAENNLPLYLGIDTPGTCHGRDTIRVHLNSWDVEAWVNSIYLDDVEYTERTSKEYRWERRHTGRLPVAGVRVELFDLHTTKPQPLSAVPS